MELTGHACLRHEKIPHSGSLGDTLSICVTSARSRKNLGRSFSDSFDAVMVPELNMGQLLAMINSRRTTGLRQSVTTKFKASRLAWGELVRKNRRTSFIGYLFR